MFAVQKLVEYYDELFPISEAQKKFYEKFTGIYKRPVRFLRISCGNGFFESNLSKSGHDVTGVDRNDFFITAANVRRRTQLMSLRFFKMDYGEMSKFLGRGFYNVISLLNSKICFWNTRDKLIGLITDCKSLLSDDGCLVIEIDNRMKFEGKEFIQLPCKESLRAKLFTELWNNGNGNFLLTMNLESGSGRMIPIIRDEKIFVPSADEIRDIAFECGYSSVDFYADFDESGFSADSDKFVAVMRV